MKIWQKLILICIAFIFFMIWLGYKFINTRNENIQFGAKEYCGDQYNRQLSQILEKAQLHQRAAASFISGDAASKTTMTGLESGIQDIFNQLDALETRTCLDNSYGQDLGTTQQYTQLKGAWQRLKDSVPGMAISSSDQIHQSFSDDLLKLYSLVGDTSNLILDPDLDTYYIMDATLLKFPAATNGIAVLTTYAQGVLRKKEVTSEDRREMISMIAVLGSNLQEMKGHIEKAYADNTSKENFKGTKDSLKSEIDSEMNTYLTSTGEFLTLLDERLVNSSSINLTADELATSSSLAQRDLYRFFDVSLGWEDKALKAREDYFANERNTTLFQGGFFIVVVMIAVFFIIRSITRPLRLAVTVSNQLAQGNLNARISSTNRDETGQLLQAMKQMVGYLNEMAEMADNIAEGNMAVRVTPRSAEDRFGNAFRKMAAYLTDMAGVAGNIAEGDLSVQVQSRSAQDNFGNAFKQMIEKLREITSNVKTTSAELAESGRQIVSSSRRTLQSAQDQAAAVQESTASASEVQQTSQVTGDRAKEIQRVLERTVQSSQGIRSQLGDTAGAMSRIQDQIRIIVQSIQQVAEKNVQIGEIIESVGELADQSQLLAINAGIEAAKAGDAGRGFSVVASEMRTLADQSKSAARRIRSIVGEVRKAAEDAAAVAETGQGRFQESMEHIQPVLHQVEELTLRVDESNQAVQQILAIVNQQIIGVEQITEAMRMIQTGVQDGVIQNQQLEKAAESLSSVSVKLSHLVESYRL